jgi:hypothetical protein
MPLALELALVALGAAAFVAAGLGVALLAAGGGSLVTAGGSSLVTAGGAGVFAVAGVLVAVRPPLELAFMTGGAPASAVVVGVLTAVVVGLEATRLHHFIGRRCGPLASQSPNQGDRTQEHNRGPSQGSDHGASPVAHKPRNNKCILPTGRNWR